MRKRNVTVFAVFLAAAGYLLNNFFVTDDNLENFKEVNYIPPAISSTAKEGIGANKHINAVVTKVVDGDTMDVSYKGKTYKVRLLDVDTPESVKSGVAVQPYAKEASDFVRQETLNKNVKLVFEKGLRDRYGRLLAHVILEDGTYLNASLVRNGFARVEIVRPNNVHEEYFYDLQDAAVEDGSGLWELEEDRRPFVKDGKGKYVPQYQLEDKAG